MDQLLCASLSHTHCWYEAGMLKVPVYVEMIMLLLNGSKEIIPYEVPRLTTEQATEESFNEWGGRGYDDSVPREVTKTAPSGDMTT